MTHQADGSAHCSIIVCGAYQGHTAFVAVRGKSAKVHNLRGYPPCTVLVVTKDWRSWVTVEGEAKLPDSTNTDAEKVRKLIRDVYRDCGDKDHPDCEEYDRAMKTQEAVAV